MTRYVVIVGADAYDSEVFGVWSSYDAASKFAEAYLHDGPRGGTGVEVIELLPVREGWEQVKEERLDT